MKAIIFDLGGVILDSPLSEIARYESEAEIPPGGINAVIGATGANGAWAKHEQGKITTNEFVVDFGAECGAAGFDIDVRELLGRIARATAIRPAMVTAVDRLAERGYLVAALTNNWPGPGHEGLASHFDVFVESVVEGFNKPDRRIYQITLERLGVDASQAVFLDDIGRNCKAAAALGMTAIKFVSPDQALRQLESVLENE